MHLLKEAAMKMVLSGVVVAALFSWGLPAWSPANAVTMQTHKQSGYKHSTADAENMSVRVEQKHDGGSAPVKSVDID
jgi:hypothetical protein